MRDFDDSTLWRISEFERRRLEAGGARLAGGPTVLPTTLLAELGRIEHSGLRGDAMEIVAACLRQRESALVYLGHEGLVWPLTLFPRERLTHSPRDLVAMLSQGARDLQVLAVEPPGLRPPGHWQAERIGEPTHYWPLAPLLWALALHGPRVALLGEIDGAAAYRLPHEFRIGTLPVPGALGPALARLRVEVAPLRAIARWPGMNAERAARLLNALYLQGGLMVLRSARSAVPPPAVAESGGWFARWRRGRKARPDGEDR